MVKKVEEKKTLNLYTWELEYVLQSFKWDCIFWPFNIMSHSSCIICIRHYFQFTFSTFRHISHLAFITFNIVYSQRFFTFWCFVLMGIYNLHSYVNIFSVDVFLPFDTLSIDFFYTIGVFYFNVLSVNFLPGSPRAPCWKKITKTQKFLETVPSETSKQKLWLYDCIFIVNRKYNVQRCEQLPWVTWTTPLVSYENSKCNSPRERRRIWTNLKNNSPEWVWAISWRTPLGAWKIHKRGQKQLCREHLHGPPPPSADSKTFIQYICTNMQRWAKLL